MFSPPPCPFPQAPNSGNNLVHTILSYDSNIMLAAIISLLLVILFVLLLHVYAKWFLVQAARRGSSRAVSVPQVLGAPFHHHFNTFSVQTTFSTSPSKGLEPSVISRIPQFVYKTEEQNKPGIECVICLSAFENEEVGRKLPKCSHAFHVECIDMWLHSHTTCPTCRAPATCDPKIADDDEILGERNQESSEITVDGLERPINNEDDLRVEIIVEVSNSAADDSSSVCSSSSSQAPSLGASLKRMMSRSRCERKIHPSGNVIDQKPESDE